MRRILLVIAVMAIVTPAYAGTPESEPASDGAFGVSFFRPPSFGASAFIAVSRRHAVHIKGARYLPLAFNTWGDVSPRADGQIYEAGASYVIYGKQLLEGPSVEVGAFARDEDIAYSEDPDVEDRRRTRHYGGRAFVGYNWRFAGTGFVAIAVGLSVFHERGFTSYQYEGADEMREDVRTTKSEVDGYFRIGFAL